MSNKIQFRRGPLTDLPAEADDGEPLWINDSGNWSLYVGRGAGASPFQLVAGNISSEGVPAAGQVCIWDGTTTILGRTGFTFDNDDSKITIGDPAGSTWVSLQHDGSSARIDLGSGALQVFNSAGDQALSINSSGANISTGGGGNKVLFFGHPDSGRALTFNYSLSQDALNVGLGIDIGNQINLVQGSRRAEDYNHDQETDPVLRVHSATSAATATTQWIGLSHNQTDGLLRVGVGDLSINTDIQLDDGTVFLSADRGSWIAGAEDSLQMNMGGGKVFDFSYNSVSGTITYQGFLGPLAPTTPWLTWRATSNYLEFNYGNATSSSEFGWVAHAPFDQLVLHTNNAWGNQLVIAPYANRLLDFNHPQTNFPTLYIQSDTTTTAQFLSFAHVQTGAEITSGTGGIKFTGGGDFEFSASQGALILPRLTTAQRNALTPVNGMLIYNSTTGKLQGYESGAWADLV